MKLLATKPLTPCSSNVGISGPSFDRPKPATPTMKALPALCCSTAVDSSVMAPSTLPLITSGSSEPPLL